MKCVQKDDKPIIRVSDSVAEAMVKNDGFRYVPKYKWKDQQGKPYRGERHGDDTITSTEK